MSFFDTAEGRTAVLLIANSLVDIAKNQKNQAKTADATREVGLPLGSGYKLVVEDGLNEELVVGVRGKKCEWIKALFTISAGSGNEGLTVTVKECEQTENNKVQIKTYFDL